MRINCPTCRKPWERALGSVEECLPCRLLSGRPLNLDHVPVQFTHYTAPERALGGLPQYQRAKSAAPAYRRKSRKGDLT